MDDDHRRRAVIPLIVVTNTNLNIPLVFKNGKSIL